MITPQAQPSTPRFTLNGELSWDGILTLLGGVLAFFGIWRQVRHAGDGLRQGALEELLRKGTASAVPKSGQGGGGFSR